MDNIVNMFLALAVVVLPLVMAWLIIELKSRKGPGRSHGARGMNPARRCPDCEIGKD